MFSVTEVTVKTGSMWVSSTAAMLHLHFKKQTKPQNINICLTVHLRLN